MDRDVLKRLLDLERRLDGLGLPERGWAPTFFDEPLTNTDFDGDSFSDVGSLTKIENTSWSTTIPTDAKALIITGAARDSGSAAAPALYFRIYSTSTATNPALTIWPTGVLNDARVGADGIVPCTDGDIWYDVNASGASTMDVWLYVVGYWT